MKISLIDFTNNAVEILIFTKKTRLSMSQESFFETQRLTTAEKTKELNYIFTTISSCWEFVDYTFLIEGVTRAFTHQLVRHRVGTSFAQQSLRTVNAENFEYKKLNLEITETEKEETETGNLSWESYNKNLYNSIMEDIKARYKRLINNGVKTEDARGILPINIKTNITMKINLRAFINMCNSRLCERAQKEFRDVVSLMVYEIQKVHPWIPKKLLLPTCKAYGYCPFPRYYDCKNKKEREGEK